jgi:hypothetical protein
MNQGSDERKQISDGKNQSSEERKQVSCGKNPDPPRD